MNFRVQGRFQSISGYAQPENYLVPGGHYRNQSLVDPGNAAPGRLDIPGDFCCLQWDLDLLEHSSANYLMEEKRNRRLPSATYSRNQKKRETTALAYGPQPNTKNLYIS